jgi:hypothetical protein
MTLRLQMLLVYALCVAEALLNHSRVLWTRVFLSEVQQEKKTGNCVREETVPEVRSQASGSIAPTVMVQNKFDP